MKGGPYLTTVAPEARLNHGMAMKAQGLTKTAMAALMRTDRRQLDRLLDPNNPSVTLSTLRRAASAVGRKLRVELA